MLYKEKGGLAMFRYYLSKLHQTFCNNLRSRIMRNKTKWVQKGSSPHWVEDEMSIKTKTSLVNSEFKTCKTRNINWKSKQYEASSYIEEP